MDSIAVQVVSGRLLVRWCSCWCKWLFGGRLRQRREVEKVGCNISCRHGLRHLTITLPNNSYNALNHDSNDDRGFLLHT